MPYHKGYTAEERRAAKTQTMRNLRADDRYSNLMDKEIIVWDGEGMKLSGPHASQHYVLFGCSARPYDPLVIDSPTGRLVFEEIADYCMSVVREYPNAIHLGYYFKYDQNMIIWSLPWPAKQALYSKGACMVTRGTTKYYIRCVFGKTIRITRILGNGDKATILIEDFAPFFASSFVKAYETLFPQPTDPRNWAIVVQGKKDRAVTRYEDLLKVTRYWRAEIIALHELAFEFRRLMFDGGFLLSEWHGPGALANYIRRNNDLIDHEWGGKEENLPPAVHEASKGAYYGGHFEQFKVGRVAGPIHSYDINSAYPAAFREIPSLQEGGEWRHVGSVSWEEWNARRNPLRTSFGVFRVRWRGFRHGGDAVLNRRIQPLPHRSVRGSITYPAMVEGWYWAPEVLVASEIAKRNKEYGFEILDSWVWEPANDDVWPWEELMTSMYNRRRQLKANKNPTQMGFKLGMNSLYGKYAQRAGGKEHAPKSHTLPIAGYITSACRAKVMTLMYACEPDSVISVETDGVYTTTPPERLRGKSLFPLSKELGEWEHNIYDEMILLQNGVYLISKDGQWEDPKTRGINPNHFRNEYGDTDIIPTLQHLATCGNDHRWAPMKFDGGESFVGLGTAIARCTKRTIRGTFSTNPFKASRLHCSWFSDSKEIDLEGRGSKRAHFPMFCRACKRGDTPDIAWHDMIVHSDATKDGQHVSTPYQLPWEKGYVEPEWSLMDETIGIPVGTHLDLI